MIFFFNYRRHEDTLPHKCEHCDSAFKYPSDVKKHQQNCSAENPTPKMTRKGNMTCRRGNRYGNAIQNSMIDRNNKCEICDKTFFDYKVLSRHINCVHKLIKTHICEICGRKFAQSGQLKTHMKGFHKQAEKELTCQFCSNRFFEHVSSLKKHILTDHPEQVVEAGCSETLTSCQTGSGLPQPPPPGVFKVKISPASTLTEDFPPKLTMT